MTLLLFKLLFIAGIAVITFSFFLLDIHMAAFLVVFLIGLNMLVFALIKHRLAQKKKPLEASERVKLAPAALRMRTIKQPQARTSFFSKFLGKKQPLSTKIDTTMATGKPQITTQQRADVAVIKDQKPDETTKMKTFKAYLLKAIRLGYPKDKVKEAALKSGWPSEIFDKTYHEIAVKHKQLRTVLAVVLLAVVFALIYILYTSELLLFPYWIKLLRHASPIFFVGAIVVLFGVTLVFIVKIRVAMKIKTVEYRIAEQKTVAEIKSQLSGLGSYQTDLDKLYAVLTERGKLTITEIAMIFGISKEQAEEWGKILKEQELATLHYPTVGEPEVIWRKLKSTE